MKTLLHFHFPTCYKKKSNIPLKWVFLPLFDITIKVSRFLYYLESSQILNTVCSQYSPKYIIYPIYTDTTFCHQHYLYTKPAYYSTVYPRIF